jgi:GNAT superfamily N-acetyltransferase
MLPGYQIGESSEPMQIRVAQDHDIASLVLLINRAYRAEDFCIVGDRTNADGIRQMMAAGQFMVIDDDAHPGVFTGAVYCSLHGLRAYLGMLSVNPDAQGRGTSRVLVDAVEQYARAAGCNFLDLTVINVRENLFGFYAKFGFAPFDTVVFPDPHKQLMPLHLVKMTKALHPPPTLAAPTTS